MMHLFPEKLKTEMWLTLRKIIPSAGLDMVAHMPVIPATLDVKGEGRRMGIQS
jgi:hypothetical protein